MDKKAMLQAMIDTAWTNYNELHEAELLLAMMMLWTASNAKKQKALLWGYQKHLP